MALIHVTLVIGSDAIDPAAHDATVNVSSEILETLKLKFQGVEVIELEDDHMIVQAVIEIENPTYTEE